jgi:uracil-DNA glycosylase
MNKEKELIKIFKEISLLNVCGKDPLKVPRDILKTNINSKVMIIAEAMAPEQVRLSGINYFFKNGKIGSTGKYLEKFLNLFEHSVYPEKKNCVYHTEIVHSFPGYEIKGSRKSIRRPSEKEIISSLKSNILEKEISIIKPKIIFLMGNTAYRTFYRYFLNRELDRNLTKEIEYISKNKKYNNYKTIPIIPIQHSSGANPRFSKMLENKKLIGLIKQIIK